MGIPVVDEGATEINNLANLYKKKQQLDMMYGNDYSELVCRAF